MATNFQLNVKVNGVDKAVSTVGQLEEALAATKQELKDIEIGSDAFTKLSKQARTLQGELELNGEKLTNFNGNLDNITQSVGRLGSTIASGFAVATAAVGLFAGESEDLTKAQVQAQQALTLAFGATTIATNAVKLNQDLKNIADAIGLNLTRSRVSAEAAHTAALGAETAATGTATVATKGFNAALAANPLGLLLVAITAVVGAIYLFSDAEEEASSVTEEATEAHLNQIKVQKEHQKVIQDLAKAQADLIILQEEDADKRIALQTELYGKLEEQQIDYLKKERSRIEGDLQKSFDTYEEINSKYLTVIEKTDKIISQSSQQVADQYGYRTQVITKYAEEERLLTQDRIDFYEKLYYAELLLNDKSNENRDERIYTQEIRNLEEQIITNKHYQKLLEIQEDALKAAGKLDDEAFKKKFELNKKNLAETLTLLQTNLTDQIKANTASAARETKEQQDATKKAQDELKKRQDAWKRSYDAIKKTVEDAYTSIEDIEDSYYDKVEELNADSAEDKVKNEKYIELQKLESIRRKFLAEVEADKTLGNKKKQILDDYDVEYKEAQDKLNEYYQIRIDAEIKAENDKTDALRFVRELLNQEISVGDQNALDNLENLKVREKEVRIRAIQAELDYTKVSAKEKKELEAEKLRLTQESLGQQRLIAIQSAEAEKNRVDAELKASFDSQKDLTEEQMEVIYGEDGIIAQAAINSKKELNTKLLEIDQEFYEKQEDAEKKSAETTQNILLEKINFYADYVFQLSNLITGLVASVNELNAVESENRLNALRDETAQQTSVLNEGYNEQSALLQNKLDNGAISQEQYNEQISGLQTKLSNSTLELDKKQKAVELKEKKKAFESDKKLKIAQAIIAGAQGALQAFTGAMQLGPIAGPIVGGILAGIVGVTTGIQVAAIKKTKFDSGAPDITAANVSSGGGVGGAGAIQQYSGGGNTQFSNGLLGTPGNGQGFTGGSGAPGGMKVYVVESDITNTQNKVKVLEGGSSFG